MQATAQAASNRTPVEVKDLWKSFGAQKVLNGIGLQVSLGQIVAVLGRSGTGKSVLLKLLAGLQPADSGSIQIAGGEITHLDLAPLNEIRKKMGFLFQQAAFYDSLTVAQNALPQHPGQKARVEMELDNDTRKVIRKDSTAAIQTGGLWATNTWSSPSALTTLLP